MKIFILSPNLKSLLLITRHKGFSICVIGFFNIKCNITKANGQNIAEVDEISVINYPVSYLFIQIYCTLGWKGYIKFN